MCHLLFGLRPWGVPPGGFSAPGGIQNLINHYFGCQIRILRGRFSPGGSLLEELFLMFDFININIYIYIFNILIDL